jgi:hypothetical protein
MVFWVMIPLVLELVTKVSEEYTAYIFCAATLKMKGACSTEN